MQPRNSLCVSTLAARLLLAIAILPGLVRADDESAAVERRLADSARYLASDELEGRGIGTKGLDLAADYIRDQFVQLGLNTELFDATPFQRFRVAAAAKPGQGNRLALVGPPAKEGDQPRRIELKLGEEFTPMAMSGSGIVDLPLVFVGYGITGKKEQYDDYAGIDAAGKALLILRHEPQQSDPNSVFNGKKHSEHAPFRRKLANALEHDAAAVIFLTDEFDVRRTLAQRHKQWQAALDKLADEHAKLKTAESPTPDQIEAQRKRIEELLQEINTCGEKLQAAYDPMLPFAAGGRAAEQPKIPVVYCRRGPLDRVVEAALGTSLTALEQQIDEGPTPHSRSLDGWRVVGEVAVERTDCEVKNVVAALEAEGPLADQTLVIGAHYDHLGWGGPGSLAPGREEIHNGADDNASGVAVLIEVARTLATREEKLRRRVAFVAFTAEEIGLVGSAHYVRNPPFPLENTVAMLNLDMVGRLRNDNLIVGGSDTAATFSQLLDEVNQSHGFQLTKRPSGFGPSDHTSFYARNIPVMHFYTGTHAQYHRPSDDFETLNVGGMRRVASLVSEIAVAIANADERPEYVSVPRSK